MPPGPAPMPMPMPAPIAPIPSASPPYLASRTAARAGRPIEPWKDALRLVMMIWGAVLIVAFMVPTSTEPSFMFQAIIDGEGMQKLEPLMIAAIGLLSLVLAFIPTSPMPRGLIAGLLGLAGILVPTLLLFTKGEIGLGSILLLLFALGPVVLVPGLLLRQEYRDSIMPRIWVTVGVVFVLLAMLIPVNDHILLVDAFKALLDGKIEVVVILGPTLLAILSLLVWLPAPSSAGAKVFAFLFIAWPGIAHFTSLLVGGHIGDIVSANPNLALAHWAVMSSYIALVGYGFATVFGKQLE
jgi:hypothetical protein